MRPVARSGREALHSAGFELVSTKTVTTSCAAPTVGTIVVPLHRQFARRTLRSILRHAALSLEEFLVLLGD